ncbi:MAG: insulinase family protein, partial [Deltaproteobacteria bacterium]|nr:insulinase family protein [Deltaproteobacteria bacterium]
TVQGTARKLGYFETVAGGVDYEKEYYRQVEEMTASHLRASLEKYLTASNLTVAVLSPEPTSGVNAVSDAKLEELRQRLLSATREEELASAERFAKKGALPGEDQVVRRILPGGMKILVKRDASVPVVAMRAVWVGGLRYEDARVNGVNHMLASLITRGTATRSAEEIMRDVEGMAGAIGGFSGRNSFGARVEMLAKNWERGLEILADCLLNPEFPEDELDKERRIVLDELSAQSDNLSTMAFRLFAETMYKKHPYRFDLLGTPSSMAGMTRRTLKDFYSRNYPLGGMTLAIVGDVDPARAIEKAAGLFGAEQPSREPPPVAKEDLWARPKGTVEVYKFLQRQQAHMVVGFPGTTLDNPNRHALEVVSTLLSGQGGRLFVELRDKKGLAYRVNAFSLEGIDPGYFAVYIACSPEKLPVALDGIREELRKIAEEPINPAELDRAKKYLVGSHEISLQRRAAVASTLAFHEAYGMGYDEYLRYSAKILAIDAAAVQRVAREYLDWQRAVIATVKPEELTPGARQRAEGPSGSSKSVPKDPAAKASRRGPSPGKRPFVPPKRK